MLDSHQNCENQKQRTEHNDADQGENKIKKTLAVSPIKTMVHNIVISLHALLSCFSVLSASNICHAREISSSEIA